MKELGLTSNTGNDTYSKITDPSITIINQHKDEMKDMFNITLNENMEKLPYMYWIPKFHKSLIKFRFIIASSTCTTKQLSQRLTIALKLIEKQHERYCAKLKTYTGINRLWIIHNSKDIHNHIQGINET